MPYAFECISKESEIWQSIEIKQEFVCKAMGELHRSIAILYAPWMLDTLAVLCVLLLALQPLINLKIFT